MGEIELLHVSVSDPRLDELGLEDVLSEPELERISKLVRGEDRARSTVGWGLSRLLLGTRTGTKPAAVRFRRNAHGKPFVPAGPAFNLAHSGDSVLIGVSDTEHLGVDVETRRRIRNLSRLAEEVFVREELAELRALPPGDREAAFFRGWTRKEAFVKAVGKGLSMPLHSFTVSLAPGWDPALRRVDGVEVGPHGWLLRSVPVPGAAEAAVACDLASARVAWIDLADLL